MNGGTKLKPASTAALPGKSVEDMKTSGEDEATAGADLKRAESADVIEPSQLEPTQSSLDHEAEKLMAPEFALEEEERLRHEREKANKDAIKDLLQHQDEGVLDTKRFDQLDQLLNKTNMYTTFLTEQMQAIEEQVTTESEQTKQQEQGAKAGSKRKGGRQGGGGKKKKVEQPEEALTPTQAMLPLINGELRDYQLKGVKWLISLYQNGLNGILADQMGLGKTVQTIGFLSHLRAKGINGPFMVLGPLSTLPNWVDEFKRWCPSFPVVMYHGSRTDRDRIRATKMPFAANCPASFPVVVTSYEIVMADVKALARYSWKYVVVDEGHRLKNLNCKLLRELRTIPMNNKLLLTGTPLQNNLSELWSLLNFLLPDIFHSLADFESWFDFSAVGQEGGTKQIVAQEQRNRVVSKLHQILRPFLLRRIKSDVETALPAKVELLMYAEMTDTQRRINQQLRDKTLNEELSKLAKSSGAGVGRAAASRLNNVLMQMRKNCNHPDLISGEYDGSVEYPPAEQLLEQCGKMQLLDRLLKGLHARGSKVLIFSQMTRMLDLIHAYLEEAGHRVCRIDGSIPWEERQAAIKTFNSDPEAFVFLLSTRAGGLGINLTAADTVIIYDSDWNPHQDLQAMDRCHRIGQTRPVLVFRLATAQSVEGRLLKRAAEKMALERLVIKKGAFLHREEAAGGAGSAGGGGTGLKAEELLELLKLDETLQEDAQAGVVSDEMLDKILSRDHLLTGKPAPYPLTGVGYEVVQQLEGSGILKGIN